MSDSHSDASRECAATRKDGDPCRGQAQPGLPYCWAHDAAQQARYAEGRRLGGRNSSNFARAARLVPPELTDVKGHLLEALAQLHSGELDPRLASAMATMAGAIVRIHQAGELEVRLVELEQRVAGEE